MVKEKDWISDLVGALFDPIVVHQCAWMDIGLPDWLKAAIKIERLIELAVACAYLNIASLEFPFDHDWTEIYMYVFTKTYGGHRTKDSEVTVPDDIRRESLDAQQMQDLKRLKDWIYTTRVKHRTEKDRAERREKREEEASRKAAEQPALFQL